VNNPLSDAVLRTRVPGGIHVADSDAIVRAACAPDVLDTTHFDTVRFPPPETALARVTEAMSDGSRAYSAYRGHQDVIEHAAAAASRILGIPVDASSEIVLTAGTQSALFAVLSALGAGKRVIVPTPEYLFDYKMLAFLNADVTTLPLTMSDGVVGLDLEQLASAARHADVLLLSNPNNPTGGLYDAETLAAIARIAVENDLFVVVDELYTRLIHPGGTMLHFAAQQGMADRTVTLLGPSKTESYSGFRVGMAVGPAAVMRGIEDVVALTALRAPAYNQSTLLAWMNDDDEWLQSRLTDFTKLRELTVSTLQRVPWLSVERPNATAYVWVDVSALGLPDVAVAERLARDAGVLVSPGYQFGTNGAGHFRMCYARDEVLWAAALERIVEVLQALAREVGLSS
jgi:aspartate/methionine/tyrosine aminotransferase